MEVKNRGLGEFCPSQGPALLPPTAFSARHRAFFSARLPEEAGVLFPLGIVVIVQKTVMLSKALAPDHRLQMTLCRL